MGLSELSLRTGLDKATTFRVARTLLEFGCLRQDPATRHYWLGIGVLDLGFAYLNSLDVREHALQAMRLLARELQEPVSLSILDGMETVYIERVRAGRLQMSLNLQVGSRLPAHSTAAGKVLLAWLPASESRALLTREPLARVTEFTLTDPKVLERELSRVREMGYAVSEQETVVGLCGIAVPIRDRGGSVTAALSTSAMLSRATRAEMEASTLPALISAADSISARIGWSGGLTFAPD
jgi:IclR family pca regulon transcriptional regulator